MCDRVCVDLCSLLQPGEGMLVGSFARALFLVHSEVGGRLMVSQAPCHGALAAVQAKASNNQLSCEDCGR